MYMQIAISLARKGFGKTGTNPLVGAIVVKNNKIVGQGFHRKIGEAHAEVCALTEAGSRAQGATLYSNLEPCCYSGQTPPCVEAICHAKIKRVVASMIDPNPNVNGKGINYLKLHNIDVTLNVLNEQAELLNQWYKKYITTKIPYIILKIALSKNGRMSGYKGKYITSESSRRRVHALRSKVSAVLVGINTLISDNPYLTDRLVGRSSPARVVIDPHLKISRTLNFLRPDSRRIVITDQDNDRQKIEDLKKEGTEFIFLSGVYYPIETIVERLKSLNIGSILVEGGILVFSEFFSKKLYDELYIFMAPKNVNKGISILDEISKEVNLDEIKPEKIEEDLLYHVYRSN